MIKLSTPVTFVACLNVATTALAASPAFWFAFGDSYTATTFNASGPLPSTANPIGNPQFPGNTTCGPVPYWITDMTVSYNRSLIYTFNLAQIGATIDNSIVPAYYITIPSMYDQVSEFYNIWGAKPIPAVPWTSSNALFSIWFGINDIQNSLTLSTNHTAVSAALISAYLSYAESLYSVGARNFLFINVPPVDRTPVMLLEPPTSQQLENQVVGEFNQLLEGMVSTFQASHSGVQVFYYDVHARLTDVLNRPSVYGLVDNSSYAVANDTVAWCNNFHPSSRVHGYFAYDVATLLNNTVF